MDSLQVMYLGKKQENVLRTVSGQIGVHSPYVMRIRKKSLMTLNDIFSTVLTTSYGH